MRLQYVVLHHDVRPDEIDLCTSYTFATREEAHSAVAREIGERVWSRRVTEWTEDIWPEGAHLADPIDVVDAGQY